MTLVKICGITNLEDALLSVKFGADMLGFNFYEKSPRYIQPENAQEIIEQLPKKIKKVGVFVNEDTATTAKIAEKVGLDVIQLHGDEPPEFVVELKAKTSLEIIKAIRLAADFDPQKTPEYSADAILLDSYSPDSYGGTGQTFNKNAFEKAVKFFPKVIIAGGLDADNVSSAIRLPGQVPLYAVDSCSRLESEPGQKDKTKLINFISNVLFSRRILEKRDDLLFLLRLFRYTPSLYLLQKSISQVCSFIFGNLTALWKIRPEFDRAEAFLKRFDEFEGIERSMFSHGVLSYAVHFLKQTDGDEERAFDLFYARLEEFLLENKDLENG